MLGWTKTTRFAVIATLGVGMVGALWAAVSVTGAEDRTVIKEETYPDGSRDIYLSGQDGEVIIEHREADGGVWLESNEVVGRDGEPVICPDGERLRIDLDRDVKEPSPEEVTAAQRGLAEGKIAVFNEFTGEFQVVDGIVYQHGETQVMAKEPLVYQCGANNEAMLVPLSDVDPEAAEDIQAQLERAIQGSDDVTGLGSDPASARGTDSP